MLPDDHVAYNKGRDECCAVCEFCDCLFYPVGEYNYRIVYRCRLYAEQVDSFAACSRYKFNASLPK
jgi:hypothetical protein